jgi:hypothetical protein
MEGSIPIVASICSRWRQSVLRVLFKGKGKVDKPNACGGIAVEYAPFRVLSGMPYSC